MDRKLLGVKPTCISNYDGWTVSESRTRIFLGSFLRIYFKLNTRVIIHSKKTFQGVIFKSFVTQNVTNYQFGTQVWQ